MYVNLFAVFLLFVSIHSVNGSILDRFRAWLDRFEMAVENDILLESMLQKWISNDRFIELHNSKNLTYKLGHNQYSAMDSEEYRKFLELSNLNNAVKMNVAKKYEKALLTSASTNLPDSVDWVSQKAVTPVKDQGQCGSCWSFSTTGALEGAYAIKMGELVSFSEQQLVDCDNRRNGGKDMGCNGGLMDNAFTWIQKNGGLCGELDYPYVSGNGQTTACQTTCNIYQESKISKYVDVVPSSDEDMMEALSLQPVSVAIEADQREFQLYKSGVFTGACGTNLDHGVLAVGYGVLEGQKFYKVKNSWGTTWGDEGYIYMGRGSEYNKGDGQCGILLSASYPVI
jgi:C1A family cysteine protease